MEIILEDIDKLIPYARNPRKNQAIDKVAASIKEFGFRQPIVVDKEMVIIVGHTRYEGAKKLGMKQVPIHIAEELTPAQVRAYRIADNRVAQDSEWDIGLLNYEFTDLLNENYDLELLGFDNKELEDLIVDKPQGLTDDDFVPDIPEKPKSKLGEIYQLGHHRVMCGDATKEEDVNKLMDGKQADMVFTDPPYGYKYLSNYQSKHKEILNDDKILDFLPACKKFMLENSTIYVCGSFQTISKWIEYVSKHFFYKNLIVWKKNNWSMGDLKGSFAGQHELIIFANQGKVEILGKRDTDVWEFNREPPKLHPTQKPIELIKFAMSKFKGGIILDLFGGSGSTLIACEKINRNCYMMEFDPIYVDVIIKRWEQWTGEKAELVKQ